MQVQVDINCHTKLCRLHRKKESVFSSYFTCYIIPVHIYYRALSLYQIMSKHFTHIPSFNCNQKLPGYLHIFCHLYCAFLLTYYYLLLLATCFDMVNIVNFCPLNNSYYRSSIMNRKCILQQKPNH